MVKPSAQVLALGVVAMIFVATHEATDGGGLVGGRLKVKDVKKNEEVQEIGRFSVKEFNREEGEEEGGALEFSQVVEAEVQVVAGFIYYMVVEAVENNETKTFESEVFEQPWIKSRQLLRFRLRK